MRRTLSPLALALILNAGWLPAYAETRENEAPVVTAREFHIKGSKAFSEAELLKVIEHSAGRELTRNELVGLADSITAFYRKHGFPRARAIIPAQNFADGIIRFLITTAPALTAPDSMLAPAPVVKASGFRIVGSRAFTEAELLPLVQDAAGRELASSDLDALAQRITDHYRKHGFTRARAVIPPQSFAGGIIRFLVTTAPPPNMADSLLAPVVKATGFRIVGSRAFTEAELLPLVNDAVGKELTAADLNALAQRITGHYRKHGYGRARAVVRPGSASETLQGIVRFLITTLPLDELQRPDQREYPAAPPSQPPADLSGDPVRTLLGRAKWWEANNRIDLSQEALDKLFNIAPDQPNGLAMQARLHIRRNQPEQAQAALDVLKGVQPDHPDIPRIEALLRSIGKDKAELRQARSLAKADRYDEAIAIFRKLFPDGPPSDDLALEYWQLVANTPRGWRPARDGIAALVKNNPENLNYRLALAEHETSRLPLDRKALEIIIDMTRLPAYSQRARNAWRGAMRRLGDSPSSLALLHQYLAIEPNDSAVREKYDRIVVAQARHRKLMADPDYRARLEGLALLDKGELEKAEPLLEQALRARPKDSELVGGMGMLRLRQGRHLDAQKHFIEAAKLTPGGSRKWTALVRTARFWQLMSEAREARKAGALDLAESKLDTALKIEPNEPNAIAALAEIQADRGMHEAAAESYRRVLAADPLNADALEGLVALYRERGMEREALQVIAQLTPAQRNALGSALNRTEASILKEQADRLLADGREDEAVARLDLAVRADADDPWSRLTLARLYAKRQQPERGQALFDDLLARRPDDSEALYALALYQSSLEQSERVLATLERIHADQRSAKTTRLWGSNIERMAGAQMRAGRRDEAARVLRNAETRAAGDEEAGLAVALAWGRLGEHREAERLFEQLRGEQPSAAWRLRHAEYLAMTDSPHLGGELDALAAMPSLSADEKEELYALQESFAIRTANGHIAANDPGLAHRTLAPFLKNAPDRVPLLLADARAWSAEERWAEARSAYEHVLRLEPEEREARRGLIDTLLAAGERNAALAQVDSWAAGGASLSGRLQLVDLYLALDETDRAERQLDALLDRHPNHPDVLNQAWQLAQHQGRLNDEIVYLQKSLAAEYAGRTPPPAIPATHEQVGFEELGSPRKIQRDWKEKKLATLLDRRTDWLSSAVDIRTRAGTAGLSQFHAVEIPVEYRTPWHQDDEVFFRTDLVKLNAGSVDPTSNNFGSQLLCQPLCDSAPLAQSARGAGFTAGYHSDRLLADVGVTPLNFPVTNLVGGVRLDGDFGKLGYSVEVSRRPVTASLLSYAGTRDTNTGQTWGGVVATGGRLGLSLDEGGTFGFWSSLGLHSLTGRNVQTNNRLQLMAGGQWRVINEENRLLSLGLTGMYWHHSRNAGEYTFGHGGYYSPQNYRSLSVPVTYGERYPRFSWVVRAAVSASRSQTQSADYFPTGPAMQAQAVALAPVTFVTPTYAGGPGRGTGYSLRGAFEYQVNKQLFVGGQLAIERSEFYAPNRALFYLRYALDRPAAQPVYFPPLPVEPSSQL
jgi:tetratricopeptide (TPR) repeat protein